MRVARRSRFLVVLAVASSSVLVSCQERREAFPAEAETLLAGVRDSDAPTPVAYEDLFRYFLTGFLTYRTGSGSAAEYPGLGSQNGQELDEIEGFTRIAPLLAAWHAGGRPAVVEVPRFGPVDVVATLRRGLLAGTDPGSPGYWGRIPIGVYDQRTVEAADVALSIWLSRQSVWRHLDSVERRNVARWLQQVDRQIVPDNNQRLLVAFVDIVLAALGEDPDLSAARMNYERFKEFHGSEGWFSDGPGDVYDFYNAWGIHYQLFWLDRVAPDWDPVWIAQVRRQFLRTYPYLIARDGIPILGRSVCYRLAAPVPLVAGFASDSGMVTAGAARRSLDLIWTHFLNHGAVRSGNVTQGYCGTDAAVLDRYSGPASCLWSLRSLIVAFVLPRESTFWTSGGEELPIDRGDYELRLKAPGWTVRGTRKTGAVSIEQSDSLPSSETRLEAYGLVRKMASVLLRHPYRPYNGPAKYERGHYSSSQPFTGCTP